MDELFQEVCKSTPPPPGKELKLIVQLQRGDYLLILQVIWRQPSFSHSSILFGKISLPSCVPSEILLSSYKSVPVPEE